MINLNNPLGNSISNWHRDHKKKLTLGERAADKLRNGMGSWGFVFTFVAFMIIWAYMNTHKGFAHWDVYPFILLNLFLSMLAGLQGAILLIAAKRQDGISAAMAEHDFNTNVRAEKEVQQLLAINHEQIELIHEQTKLIQELRVALQHHKH